MNDAKRLKASRLAPSIYNAKLRLKHLRITFLGRELMSDSATSDHISEASLNHLKEFSGRRIESERLRRRLTQKHLARRVGLSTRWLREVESGNPAVALDDHLRCAAALHLAPAFVLLPLLDPDYNRMTSNDRRQPELADLEYLIWNHIGRRAGRNAQRDDEMEPAAIYCCTEVRVPSENQLTGERSSSVAQDRS